MSLQTSLIYENSEKNSKSHDELRQYMLEKQGVDIGGNVNALHVALIVVFALVAITSPFWIEKLVDWHNKRK